jgi:hypothetical protein
VPEEQAPPAVEAIMATRKKKRCKYGVNKRTKRCLKRPRHFKCRPSGSKHYYYKPRRRR